MTPERNAPTLERPLGARSLIASLLLGMRTPRLSGARLVRWCGLFGIAEGTARVALSRMVDRGELTVVDGTYELAGRVRGRQPAQDWSIAAELGEWNGEWRTAVVTGDARTASARSALRTAMRTLRYAELREGVWTRPDNLPRESAPAEAWAVADDQCEWWTGRPDEDDADLATDLFAPVEWAERARDLSARLRSARDDLADAFMVGAAALAHIRADPLLPAALCPPRWPGERIRTEYREYQAAFAAAVRDWFRSA